jgi:hypothetical protein
LNGYNAAQSFPDVARNLQEKRAGYFEKTGERKKKKKSWRRLLSMKREYSEEEPEDPEYYFLSYAGRSLASGTNSL